MQSKATTVEQYLAELPEDRRAAIRAVREVILENLDDGYEEGMQYGMIGYFVPHRVFPAGYHCDPAQPLPYVTLGLQKNHIAIHMMPLYGDPALLAWFTEAWKKTGKKLDLGKACVRFKKLDDLPLAVIGETIRRVPARTYIDRYQATVGATRKAAAKKAPAAEAKKPAAKKPAAKKPAAKKPAAKKPAAKATAR